jgi:sporulation integral membrane protein YtvI
MEIRKWYIKYFLLLIFLLISLLFLKHFFVYFTPFIIAAVIASLINPIVDFLDKKIPVHRGFSVIIVLVLVLVILITFIFFGGAQVYLELNRLLRNLPDYRSIDTQIQWLAEQNEEFQQFIANWEISDAIKESINNNLQMLYNGIRSSIISFINSILELLSKLPRVFMILFISFIAAFFISRDREHIKEFLVNLFPEDVKPKIANVFSQLNLSAVGYIRALLILITITGFISGIGVTLIGNQYALIVGITAAILDLIPIIGPALLFYPWIIISILYGNTSQAFALFLLHITLSVVRSASEGKIMGEHLGLHPLATMISLYSGYMILGTIGFVVGPTFLVLIKAIADSDLIDINEE